MLTPEDRRAIEGLFDKLRDVERSGGQRDPEAEQLIAGLLRRQDGASYYMAQTILVQETALKMAEERISELERLVGERSRQVEPQRQRGPWDREDRYGGGGFLAGAAQTALGVTGGILIGSAIASILSGSATAGEWGGSQTDAPAESADAEADADADNDFGDSGDFGDDGGFDFGGDF